MAYDKASILHRLEKLATIEEVQADRNGATGTELSDNQVMQVALQVADTAVEHTHVDPAGESSSY